MYKAILFVGAGAMVLAGCKGAEEETANPTTPPTAPPTAAGGPPAGTYAAVQFFFNQNCTTCHGAGNPKAGINLTNYDSVMKGGHDGPIVKAGDPENSVLVQVLRASHGMKQMPPMKPAAEDQIKSVEDWIKGGAKKA